MPLVKEQVSVAAGATQADLLGNTIYRDLVAGQPITIAVAAASAGTKLSFKLNNEIYSDAAEISVKVDGEPFGVQGSYVVHDSVAGDLQKNIPKIDISNPTGAAVVVDYAIFIGDV